MSKLYACIISERAKSDKEKLLSVAEKLSHRIELLDDGVLLDVSGLENLIGTPQQIADKISDLLQKNRINGNARVAETANTAILLARQTGQQSTFQQLPLQSLPIEDDTLNVLRDLGIRTISELRQIPAEELIRRYGSEFKNVLDVVEESGRRLLTPNIQENSVAWAREFDFPVDDFEQLIFVINHGLDKLLEQVSDHGFSTELQRITFKLQNRTEKDYEIKTSFPTLERSFWLKLINLRISLDPPEAEIVSVRIVTFFARPRPDQRGLYAVSRPEPENLLLTVDKIKNLVGKDNVGVPVLLDQRMADAFALDPEQIPQGVEEFESGSEFEQPTAAFNYFHPPIPVRVAVENDRLRYIRTPHFDGNVTEYSGVWKENSRWWDKPWKTQEWDIEVDNRGVDRLCKTVEGWFLRGEYD